MQTIKKKVKYLKWHTYFHKYVTFQDAQFYENINDYTHAHIPSNRTYTHTTRESDVQRTEALTHTTVQYDARIKKKKKKKSH